MRDAHSAQEESCEIGSGLYGHASGFDGLTVCTYHR